MKSKINKILFLAITLDVFIIFLAGFLVYQVYQNKTAIKFTKTEILSEKQQLENIDTLRKLVSTTANSRQQIDKLFIDQDNTIEFLEFLESLGKLSGAEVEIISVESEDVRLKTEDKKVLGKGIVNLRFEGIGRWSQIYKLIGFVSNMPISAEIIGMDVGLENDSEANLWKVNFEIIVDKM